MYTELYYACLTPKNKLKVGMDCGVKTDILSLGLCMLFPIWPWVDLGDPKHRLSNNLVIMTLE